MLFIGDVHQEFKRYLHILFRMQHKGGRKGVDRSLQVGDMGIGFPPDPDSYSNPNFFKDGVSWFDEIDNNHRFLRGNHDDPTLCNSHSNYLGDWGYIPAPDMFFVSGGFSIDHYYRIPGKTLWKDEELSQQEMEKVLKSYEKNKSKIVVSHECPLGLKIDFVTNYLSFHQ